MGKIRKLLSLFKTDSLDTGSGTQKENTKRNIMFFAMIFGVFAFNFIIFLSAHGGDIKAGFQRLLAANNVSKTEESIPEIAGAEIDDFYLAVDIPCAEGNDQFYYDADASTTSGTACTVWTTSPTTVVNFNQGRAKENATVWSSIVDFMKGLTGAGIYREDYSNISYKLSAETMNIYEVFGWTSTWNQMNVFETFFTTNQIHSGSKIAEINYRWNMSENSSSNILYRIFEYVPNWKSDGSPAGYVPISGLSGLTNNLDYGSTVTIRVNESVYNQFYQVKPYATFEESGKAIFSSLPQNTFNSIAGTADRFYIQDSSVTRSIYTILQETQEYYAKVSGGDNIQLNTLYDDTKIAKGSDNKYTVAGIPSLSGIKYDTIEAARTAMIEANRPNATRSFLMNGRYYIYCSGDSDCKTPHFKQYDASYNTGVYQWKKWDGSNNSGYEPNIFDYYINSNGKLFVALSNAQIKEQEYFMESMDETYSHYSTTTGFGSQVTLNDANSGRTLSDSANKKYVWEDWYKYNIVYDRYDAVFYDNYMISSTSFEASKPGGDDEFIYVKVSNVALFAANFYQASYGNPSYYVTFTNPNYTNNHKIINVDGKSIVSESISANLNKIDRYRMALKWNNSYGTNDKYKVTTSFNNLSLLLADNITNYGLYKDTAEYNGTQIDNIYFNFVSSAYKVYKVTVPYIYVGPSDSTITLAPDSNALKVWGSIIGQTQIYRSISTPGSGNPPLSFTLNSADIAIRNVFYADSSNILTFLTARANSLGYSTPIGPKTIGSDSYYVFANNNTNKCIYLKVDYDYIQTLTLTMYQYYWTDTSSSTHYCRDSSTSTWYLYSSSSIGEDCGGSATVNINGFTKPNTYTSISYTRTTDGYYALQTYKPSLGSDSSYYFTYQYRTPKWTDYQTVTTADRFYVLTKGGTTYAASGGKSLSYEAGTTFFSEYSKYYDDKNQSGNFIYFPGPEYNFKNGSRYYTLIGFRTYNTTNSDYIYRYISSTTDYITEVYVGSYLQKHLMRQADQYYKLTVRYATSGAWNRNISEEEDSEIYMRGNQLATATSGIEDSMNGSWTNQYRTPAPENVTQWNSGARFTTDNTTEGSQEVMWGKGLNWSTRGRKLYVSSVSPTSMYFLLSGSFSIGYSETMIDKEFYSRISGYNTFNNYSVNSGYTKQSDYFNKVERNIRVMYGSLARYRTEAWNSEDQCVKYSPGNVYTSKNNCYTARTIDSGNFSMTSISDNYFVLNNAGNSACTNHTIYSREFDNPSRIFARRVMFYEGKSGSSINDIGIGNYAKGSSIGDVFTTGIAQTYTSTTGYCHDFSTGADCSGNINSGISIVDSNYNWSKTDNHFDSGSNHLRTGKIVQLFTQEQSSFKKDSNPITVEAKYYGSYFVGIDSISGFQNHSGSLFDYDSFQKMAKQTLNTHGYTTAANPDDGRNSYIGTLLGTRPAFSSEDLNNVNDNYGWYYRQGENFDISNNTYYENPGSDSIFKKDISILGEISVTNPYSRDEKYYYYFNRQKLATLSDLLSETLEFVHVDKEISSSSSDSLCKVTVYESSPKLHYGNKPEVSEAAGEFIIKNGEIFYAVTSETVPTIYESTINETHLSADDDFAMVEVATGFDNGYYYFASLGDNYTTGGKTYTKITFSSAIDPLDEETGITADDFLYGRNGYTDFVFKGVSNEGIIQDIQQKTLAVSNDLIETLSGNDLLAWYIYDPSTGLKIKAPDNMSYDANINALTITGSAVSSTYYFKNNSNTQTVYGVKNTPINAGTKTTKYFYGNPTTSNYHVNYSTGDLIVDAVINSTIYLKNSMESGDTSITASNSSGSNLKAFAQSMPSEYTNIASTTLDICSESELLSKSTSCYLEPDASIVDTNNSLNTNVSYSDIQVKKYLYAKYYSPRGMFKNWEVKKQYSITYERSSYSGSDADARLLTSISNDNIVGKVAANSSIAYDYTDKIKIIFVRNENASRMQRFYTELSKNNRSVTTDTWYKEGRLTNSWDASLERYSDAHERTSIAAKTNKFNLDGWIGGLLFNNSGTYLNVGNTTIRQTPNVYISTYDYGKVKYRINFNAASTLEATVDGLTAGKTYILSIKGTDSGDVRVAFGNTSNYKSIATSTGNDPERTDITFQATGTSTEIYIIGTAGSYLDIKWMSVLEGSSFSSYVPYSESAISSSSIHYTSVEKTGEKYHRYDNKKPFMQMMYLSTDGQAHETQQDLYPVNWSAQPENLSSYPTFTGFGDYQISQSDLETKLQNSEFANSFVNALLSRENDHFISIPGTVSKVYEFTALNSEGKEVTYMLVPVKNNAGSNIVESKMSEYGLEVYLEIVGYGSNDYFYFNKQDYATDDNVDNFEFTVTNPVTNNSKVYNFDSLVLYSTAIGDETHLDDPGYDYKNLIMYKDGNLYIPDAGFERNRTTTIYTYGGTKIDDVNVASNATVLTKTNEFLNSRSDVINYAKTQSYIDVNYNANGSYYNRPECWRDVTNTNASYSDSYGTLTTVAGDQINYQTQWKVIGYGQLACTLPGFDYFDIDENEDNFIDYQDSDMKELVRETGAAKGKRVIFSFDGNVLKIKNIVKGRDELQQYTISGAQYNNGGSLTNPNLMPLTIDNIRSLNVKEIYDASGNILIENVNTGDNKTYIISSAATYMVSNKTFSQTITSVDGYSTTFTLPSTKYSLRTDGKVVYSTSAVLETNQGVWQSSESAVFYANGGTPNDVFGLTWAPNRNNNNMKANSIFLQVNDFYYLIEPNSKITKYKEQDNDLVVEETYNCGSPEYNNFMNSSEFKYGMAAQSSNSTTNLIYKLEPNDASIFSKDGHAYLISGKNLKLYYLIYKDNLDNNIDPVTGEEIVTYHILYYWGTSGALRDKWAFDLKSDENALPYYDDSNENFLTGEIAYDILELNLRATVTDENGVTVDLFDNYAILTDKNGKEIKFEINALFKSSGNVLYKYNLTANDSNYVIKNPMQYYVDERYDGSGGGFYTREWDANTQTGKSTVVSVTDASGIDASATYNEQIFFLGCGAYNTRMISGVAAAIVMTPKNTVLVASNTIYNKVMGGTGWTREGSTGIAGVFEDITVEENGDVFRYASKFQVGLYEYYLLADCKKLDGSPMQSSYWKEKVVSGSHFKEEIPEYILINNGTANFVYTSRKIPQANGSWAAVFNELDGAATSQTSVSEFSYSTAYLYAFFDSEEPRNVIMYEERMLNLINKIDQMYNIDMSPKTNKITFDNFLKNIATYAQDSRFKQKLRNRVGGDTWLLTSEGLTKVLNSSYISWECNNKDYTFNPRSTDFAKKRLNFFSDGLGGFFTDDSTWVDYGDYAVEVEKNSDGDYYYKIYSGARRGQSQTSLIHQALEDSKDAYKNSQDPIMILYTVQKDNMMYVYLEIQDTDYIQADGSTFNLGNMVSTNDYTSHWEIDNGFFDGQVKTTSKNETMHKAETYTDDGWWTYLWGDNDVDRARETGCSRLVTGVSGNDAISVTHPLNDTLPLVSTREKAPGKTNYLFDNFLYNGDYALEIQVFGVIHGSVGKYPMATFDTNASGGFRGGYYFNYPGDSLWDELGWKAPNYNNEAWKKYWFYRSTLTRLEPTLYVKGTDAWDTKYTTEKRAIDVEIAQYIYPTSMLSLLGTTNVYSAVTNGKWAYSTYSGKGHLTLATGDKIGKGSLNIYGLFAFDTSKVTLSINAGETIVNGDSIISKYTTTLKDAKLNITQSGETVNDTNGLSSNDMNTGTNLYTTFVINGITYSGSGTKVSEYNQGKEYSIKVTELPDEEGKSRPIDYETDREMLSKWGYVLFKEANDSWAAYYVGTVKKTVSGRTTEDAIEHYSFRDKISDGTVGNLWVQENEGLTKLTIENLIGGATYVFKFRERFCNGDTSKITVFTIKTGADKVNNPWGTTLLNLKNENGNQLYGNKDLYPWAQELIDIYVRNAFFTYSESYSDKLFLMTGGIIFNKNDEKYYSLNAFDVKDCNGYNLVGIPNSKLPVRAVNNQERNISQFLNNDIPDGCKDYYTNGISVGLAKQEKTKKYLGNSSFIKGLHIPDTFRYRYYNDGQKPTRVLITFSKPIESAQTSLVFETKYGASESETYVVPYNSNRNAYVVDLYSPEARKVGITDKYLNYFSNYGKIVTVEDLVPGKFDVLNDVLLTSGFWNIYLMSSNDRPRTFLDKDITISGRFDVAASYECFYLDFSVTLNNPAYVNGIIDSYVYKESPAGFYIEEDGEQILYDVVKDMNKVIGYGYDVNIVNDKMTYTDGTSSNFSDRLGNKEVGGRYTNETSVSVILTKEKAAVAEELPNIAISSYHARRIISFPAEENSYAKQQQGIDVLYYLCEVGEDGKVIGILRS